MENAKILEAIMEYTSSRNGQRERHGLSHSATREQPRGSVKLPLTLTTGLWVPPGLVPVRQMTEYADHLDAHSESWLVFPGRMGDVTHIR